jgi:5-formyltetrahydrofolate cyclo-ligase
MTDRQHAIDDARWRKTQGLRLTDLRQSISAPERRQNSESIMRQLDGFVTPTPETIIRFYRPIKAEPNLLVWKKRLYRDGSRIALPVVETINAPMAFREWTPYAPMQTGIWNIPIPSEGEMLVPTVVIAPVVGFDAAKYRLGNGGGYFDRILAELISNK